jgi:hypothetical protein
MMFGFMQRKPYVWTSGVTEKKSDVTTNMHSQLKNLDLWVFLFNVSASCNIYSKTFYNNKVKSGEEH